MTLETDLLIDRRHLKRRLVFWRTLAVLALVGVVLVALRSRDGGFGFAGPYVARVRIDGVISSEDKLAAQIRGLADRPEAKALILAIDSPGGSVTGGEALHEAIADVAAKKPVVAVMGGVAASAGYMIAVPAQRIFARDGTLTGSIGVYLQNFDVGPLLDRIGIDVETFKSGPLKDEPSPFEKTSPAGQQMLQGIVADYYDQFVQMVAAGRHMDAAKVRKLADGRPYTGRQALGLGLVDQIGGERAARAWLAKAKGVPETLRVRDLEQQGFVARTVGESLAGISIAARKYALSQWLNLDGIWSLWQRPAD
jgi:protease-4